MKPLLFAMLAVLFVVSPATAQQSQTREQHLLKRGARNILVGSALVVAGLVTMPITGGNDSHKDTQRLVGASVTLAGAGFVLWGIRDRYVAVRPQVTVGATFGRSNAIYIRRQW